MSEITIEETLQGLSAAEEFLDFFGIAYDPHVVEVYRLHILQRFHDYLARTDDLPAEDGPRRATYARWLARAYQDFVGSSAAAEKVFRVFTLRQPQPVSVPVEALTGRKRHASAL